MRINNSDGKPYYSQRNNKVDPYAACNVTAMIDAARAAGWSFPKSGGQPEDDLITFIRNDPECTRLWIKYDPLRMIPPNQWHAVLDLGFNRWIGAQASYFTTEATKEQILDHLLAGGTCAVSGSFPKTHGHVVALVGADYDPVAKAITGFIIDDPWGDYRTQYMSWAGDDVLMPIGDFLSILREEKSEKKFCHFIKKAGEAT